MAGCGIMHGGRVGVAVGRRVGGVGRAEGASVNGWSLGALNAAARWAFRVGAGGVKVASCEGSLSKLGGNAAAQANAN
jgi:hypothetical protein